MGLEGGCVVDDFDGAGHEALTELSHLGGVIELSGLLEVVGSLVLGLLLAVECNISDDGHQVHFEEGEDGVLAGV